MLKKHMLKPFHYLHLRHISLHPKAGGCYQFGSHNKVLGLQIVTQNLSISDFTKIPIRLQNRSGVVFQTLGMWFEELLKPHPRHKIPSTLVAHMHGGHF